MLLIGIAAFLIYCQINKPAEGAEVYADIYSDNQLIMHVPLSEPQIIEIPGKPDVQIEIRDNSAAFIASDCPDKICIHTGFINASGKTATSAACLPKGVIIMINTGDKQPEVDTTA